MTLNSTAPDANLATPNYDDMLQTVLDALRVIGGQAKNADIAAYVIQALGLPPAVTQRAHKEGFRLTELEYRLQWTRTYLRQFGLIDSPRRGLWALTEAGWRTEQVEPSEIVRTVRNKMEAERSARDGQTPIFDDLVAPPVGVPVLAAQPNSMLNDRAAQTHDQALDNAESPSSPLTDSPPAPPELDDLRSPTPLLPTYANARHFLRILDGTASAAYQAMATAIYDLRGSPQEQEDWSDPNTWIAQRLDGANRELARRIWLESQRQLNPRYTRGCWYLATKHGLLTGGRNGTLRVTERGYAFADQPGGLEEIEIDAYEGLLIVLQLVAEQGTARRSTLLPAYGDYCHTKTTFQSENVIKTALYDRLRNLIDRGLVAARGNSYEVTEAGLGYLERQAQPLVGKAKPVSQSADLFRLLRTLREEARHLLRDYLSEMDAFKFEELVKLMLEAMGYENVNTTSPTNDKGIDVVGTIKLGISAVREVVQVKRHRGTIGRPILDQLRGSLHRFNAVRGTIITTGKFSKGAGEAAFEAGVAPITLIDGEKLLDMLMENEIGVTLRKVEYYEFAPEKLAQFEEE